MIKYYWFVLLLFVLFANGLADDNEQKVDNQAYFICEVNNRTIQLDLSWSGNLVKGKSYSGDKCKNIKGEVTGSYQRKLVLSGEDERWELQRDSDPNYYGIYFDPEDEHNVKLVRVAQWVHRTISFAGQSDIKLYYPFFFGKNAVDKKVNTLIKSNMDGVEKQFDEYLSKPEYFYLGFSTRFDCFKSASVKFYSRELVSVAIDYRVYSGGAHGNYGMETINVIERDGTAYELKLTDLFAKESEQLILCDLVRGQLKDKDGVDSIPDNDKELLDMMNEFYISYNGITFYFAPYVLGCYGAGDFKVTLSWEQLDNIAGQYGILKLVN